MGEPLDFLDPAHGPDDDRAFGLYSVASPTAHPLGWAAGVFEVVRRRAQEIARS